MRREVPASSSRPPASSEAGGMTVTQVSRRSGSMASSRFTTSRSTWKRCSFLCRVATATRTMAAVASCWLGRSSGEGS